LFSISKHEKTIYSILLYFINSKSGTTERKIIYKNKNIKKIKDKRKVAKFFTAYRWQDAKPLNGKRLFICLLSL
jgi:hypothetical protein